MSSIRGLSTANAAETLVSQWRQSPRLQSLVRQILDLAETDLLAPLRQMESQRTLSTARGQWLDWLGERMGQARPAITTGHPVFGFSLDDTGWDQAPFATLDVQQAAQSPAGDPTYRDLLMARSVALLSRATEGDLSDETGEVGTQTLVRWGSKAMTMVITGRIAQVFSRYLPAPAGVALTVEPDTSLSAGFSGGDATGGSALTVS